MEPLSSLTNELRELSSPDNQDTLFTGKEFAERFGDSGPIDTQPNKMIATAGGDIQTAYSKLNSVYTIAKEYKEASDTVYRLQSTSELNTEPLVQDIEIATEKLSEAIEKLSGFAPEWYITRLQDIAEEAQKHQTEIKQTGIVRVE